MTPKDPLLQPFQLRHLQLRNRILSTSHAPAYAEGGHPRDRYRLYHEEKAKGGVALTMIGGSTNISPDSPSVFGQLYAGDDSIIPWFQKLTEGVKSHGAAIMCQITHMGRRTVGDYGSWLPVIGPSATRERAHRSYPKPMDVHDIKRVTNDFADAAARCQKGGFDGIELLSHSHLLGQFLSPLINRRSDNYGGDLDNRLRLMREVVEAVRDRVGDEFIIGLRIAGDELIEGGLDAGECIEIARLLEASGMVDFLNVFAGAPYDDLGLADWVPPMGNPSAPHVNIAGHLRAAVSLPVFHAGGVADIATARWAVAENKVDMIGMTRAHIADPYLVQKLSAQREGDIRPCVGLGYCVDRVNQGKDALCGHNSVAGREAHLQHIIVRDLDSKKKAVVVGGGPAGMEAARILQLRGFEVVLFEASERLGGQIVLAGQGKTRKQILGVGDWLASQIKQSGVDIRYNCYAEKEEVLAENPDLVVIATGGVPASLTIEGGHFAHSTWDILLGESVAGDILLFDDRGDHQAAVAAEVMADKGATVFWKTPDRTPLIELGPTNSSVVMRELYKRRVKFETHTELLSIQKTPSKYLVTMRNVLTQEVREQTVDHVVTEGALLSMTDVFEELVPDSRNGGAVDIPALAEGSIVLPKINPDGLFSLLRVGDAVASRNIHAAIYDSTRFFSGGLDVL